MANIIDGTYDFYDDFIRVTLAATASEQDRAAVQGFLAGLAKRSSAPTPDEIDSEFANVDPEIREWFKRLLTTVDWKRLRPIVQFLLPLLVAWHLSQDTDHKVAEVSTQLQELERRTEQIQTELRQHFLPDGHAVQVNPPTTSPRANPKGTPPRQPPPKRDGRKTKRRGQH
jgi:hypothetical protein